MNYSTKAQFIIFVREATSIFAVSFLAFEINKYVKCFARVSIHNDPTFCSNRRDTHRMINYIKFKYAFSKVEQAKHFYYFANEQKLF